MRHIACVLFMFLLAACGGEEPDPVYYTGTPTEHFLLRIWVEKHSAVDPEVVRQGCSFWNPEGIECELVDDPDQADLPIKIRTGSTCDEDGFDFLGRSPRHSSDVLLYVDCLLNDSDNPHRVDPDLLRQVAAHEVGHRLGLYYHVWEDCQTVSERDPRAPAVCGKAVMNQDTFGDLTGETVIDHEAWFTRNRYLSVVDNAWDDTAP